MTIESPETFVASMWDWAVLDGCFGGTRIKPTDIDGCIERNGRLLILETKLPHADIPYGQSIMFENLRNSGIVTIFVIWGNPGNPVALKYWTSAEVSSQIPCNMELLRKHVESWFRYADSKLTPKLDVMKEALSK